MDVWKDLFIGKVFGKTCLSSKSPSGNSESRSDNSPDNFAPKVRFFLENLKKILPTSPPFPEEIMKLNIFPGKILFLEKLIWTDKDTILPICFESLKDICWMSGKSLEKFTQPKQTVYVEKKTYEFVQASFHDYAESF